MDLGDRLGSRDWEGMRKGSREIEGGERGGVENGGRGLAPSFII